MSVRIIVHVDMDAFFASIEQRDNPALRGRPLVIGGHRDSKRGVVSTCSYEARVFGIHSAMPISQAVKLCPHAIFMPGCHKKYTEVSSRLKTVFDAFSPIVESVSCDEAFLDMTGCDHFYKTLESMGTELKEAVARETGLTCSVGIADNKFLAKLGSELDKPDGLVVIRTDDVTSILEPLSVGRLWGVGERAAMELRALGVCTVAQLKRVDLSMLVEKFGKQGKILFDLARGLDSSRVCPSREVKSISTETTFVEDVSDIGQLESILADMSHSVGRRLRATGKRARTVTLKLRYIDFTTITRSRTLSQPMDDDPLIKKEAQALLRHAEGGRPIRLIGIGVSNLTVDQQLSLMMDDVEVKDKSRKATAVLDNLEDRFGAKVIRRGDRL